MLLQLLLVTMANRNSNLSSISDKLQIVSYNMHGFNNGYHVVDELSVSVNPDVFIVQEHWLTPANLSKFDENFPQYLCIGTSAMRTCVESGVLRGRPFGGVMTLINRKFQKNVEIICTEERFVVVAVGMLLIINVYLPCSGTADRITVYEHVLNSLLACIIEYPNHKIVIGGDFNTNLDKNNPATDLLIKFASDNGLHRSDVLVNSCIKLCTYFNEALNNESTIDYFLVNDKDCVLSFETLDPDINFSDHRPIAIAVIYKHKRCDDNDNWATHDSKPRTADCTTQLRWDHANLDLYRHITGEYLRPVYEELIELEKRSEVNSDVLDCIYNRIIVILRFGSDVAVPSCKKSFFKFWWDNEMNELKEKSIASCRMWKATGRPRCGPIFDRYRRDKAAYRHGIRSKQRNEKEIYTNDLHEALIQKQGKTFWRCWKSKFDSRRRQVGIVDGSTDERAIAEQFAHHFAKACSSNTVLGATRLEARYKQMRSDYHGHAIDDRFCFDAELLENVIIKMKRGKAAGLDGITTEHLKFCHALLPCVLSSLFNLMLIVSHVPAAFGQSYTVPIPKGNCNLYGKTLSADDFRGIAISPVLSKALEHCILDRYSEYFVTSDNQFGFKRNSSCAKAVYTLRSAVDYYVSFGSTVNMCSIDLSKAFDKMNHHGLLTKLMEKNIPVNLLSLLERWFALSETCVKWGQVVSSFVNLLCGVRQGGVLSPHLFAVFIDSIADKIKSSGLGCYVKWTCMSVFLYADDIILLAPSVTSLQQLLLVCEHELYSLDMAINVK